MSSQLKAKYNIVVPGPKGIGIALESKEGILVSLKTERGIIDVGFDYRLEAQYEEFDIWYRYNRPGKVVCVGTDIETGMIIAKGDNIMKCAVEAKTKYNSEEYIKYKQTQIYQKCVRLIRECEQREASDE